LIGKAKPVGFFEMNVLMPTTAPQRSTAGREFQVDRRVGLDHRLLGETGQDR
jgi:hypothetical protein